MGKVSIIRIDDNIKGALDRAIDLTGGINNFIGKNDSVMIKPNLNGTEGITDIRLTEALIQLLNDYGMRKPIVAESTFGSPAMTDMFFNKTGYAELAKKYDLPLINLNRSEIVEKDVNDPMILPKIKIAREVLEADAIINLPVMKVHYATGITLAMKNLKGILVGDEKRHFHESGLNESIVDLNSIIKPRLNIIDCITCMEKMGPRGGELFNLDLVIAGAEPAETDYAGSLLMGFDLDEVKHLKYYIEKFNVNINDIEILGEDINKVKRPFKKPVMQNIIPENFVIHEKDACSSCMNALLLSFQMLDENPGKKAHVYLGTNEDAAHNDDGLKIGFGRCCKGEDFDIKINGCPPYPFDLKNKLAGKQ